MKLWLTNIVLGICALATFTLTACEDDNNITLAPDSTPTLTASTNTVVLAQGNNRNEAITFTWDPIKSFTWTNAQNPYTPAVTYAIQMDKKGNNFAAPVSIDAGKNSTASLTVGELNLQLNNLGLVAGTPTPVEVRLKSTYANNSPVYSPVLDLTATSFVCKAPTADVWSIIGPAGVDWNTDVVLTYDCDLQAYTLTRALNAGEFKFRRNRDWTVSYGSTTPRDAAGAAPVDTNANNNITVPEAGTYTIAFYPDKLTYSLSK